MDHYAGIDVSLEASSVCVVDGTGKILREAKIASEPAALIGWFASLGLDLARIVPAPNLQPPAQHIRNGLGCNVRMLPTRVTPRGDEADDSRPPRRGLAREFGDPELEGAPARRIIRGDSWPSRA